MKSFTLEGTGHVRSQLNPYRVLGSGCRENHKQTKLCILHKTRKKILFLVFRNERETTLRSRSETRTSIHFRTLSFRKPMKNTEWEILRTRTRSWWLQVTTVSQGPTSVSYSSLVTRSHWPRERGDTVEVGGRSNWMWHRTHTFVSSSTLEGSWRPRKQEG